MSRRTHPFESILPNGMRMRLRPDQVRLRKVAGPVAISGAVVRAIVWDEIGNIAYRFGETVSRYRLPPGVTYGAGFPDA